jgi:hypothetical protein
MEGGKAAILYANKRKVPGFEREPIRNESKKLKKN